MLKKSELVEINAKLEVSNKKYIVCNKKLRTEAKELKAACAELESIKMTFSEENLILIAKCEGLSEALSKSNELLDPKVIMLKEKDQKINEIIKENHSIEEMLIKEKLDCENLRSSYNEKFEREEMLMGAMQELKSKLEKASGYCIHLEKEYSKLLGACINDLQ